MKKYYLFVACVLFSMSAPAQDTLRRGVYVGIDVLKNVWPLVGLYPDLRSAYSIEPSIIIPLGRSHRYLHITPGFARFSGNNPSTLLAGQGYYLKAGWERRKRKFGAGLAGLLVAWRDEGTYRFTGTYFGDHVGAIPKRNRVAVGSELFLSYLIPIKSRLAIRLQPRVTVLAPFTGYADRADPPYLPGVGLIEGSHWKVSNGFSLQLFYRTSSN
jgi:hypothetical protein